MNQKAASQERGMYDIQWYQKEAPRVVFQRKKEKTSEDPDAAECVKRSIWFYRRIWGTS